MKKLFVAIAFLFATLASPAFAAPQDFTIVNHTGHVVMTLNVSATGDDEWGPDILGVDVLANGESARSVSTATKTSAIGTSASPMTTATPATGATSTCARRRRSR